MISHVSQCVDYKLETRTGSSSLSQVRLPVQTNLWTNRQWWMITPRVACRTPEVTETIKYSYNWTARIDFFFVCFLWLWAQRPEGSPDSASLRIITVTASAKGRQVFTIKNIPSQLRAKDKCWIRIFDGWIALWPHTLVCIFLTMFAVHQFPHRQGSVTSSKSCLLFLTNITQIFHLLGTFFNDGVIQIWFAVVSYRWDTVTFLL